MNTQYCAHHRRPDLSLLRNITAGRCSPNCESEDDETVPVVNVPSSPSPDFLANHRPVYDEWPPEDDIRYSRPSTSHNKVRNNGRPRSAKVRGRVMSGGGSRLGGGPRVRNGWLEDEEEELERHRSPSVEIIVEEEGHRSRHGETRNNTRRHGDLNSRGWQDSSGRSTAWQRDNEEHGKVDRGRYDQDASRGPWFDKQLTGSERYEQRLEKHYMELKRLVLRSLDPQILNPIVRQQARQLLQQYHLRGTGDSPGRSAEDQKTRRPLSDTLPESRQRKQRTRNRVRPESGKDHRSNGDIDNHKTQNRLNGSLRAMEGRRSDGDTEEVEYGTGRIHRSALRRTLDNSDNSDLLNSALSEGSLSRKRVSFHDELDHQTHQQDDTDEADGSDDERPISTLSANNRPTTARLSHRSNSDDDISDDGKYSSDFSSSSDKDEEPERAAPTKYSEHDEPKRHANSSKVMTGRNIEKQYKRNKSPSNTSVKRTQSAKQTMSTVKAADDRSRQRERHQRTKDVKTVESKPQDKVRTDRPSPSSSRSPSRSPGSAGFHLKFTTNDEIRSWLRDKNRTLRQQKREKRKEEREKRKVLKEKEMQKEERKRIAELKFLKWVEEKKREDKLLHKRQQKSAQTLGTSDVENDKSDVKNQLTKSKEASRNGKVRPNGGSGVMVKSSVPAFSRHGNYNSFPGGLTWKAPGKKMTEAERRKAYGDWLRSTRTNISSHGTANQVEGFQTEPDSVFHVPHPPSTSAKGRPQSTQNFMRRKENGEFLFDEVRRVGNRPASAKSSHIEREARPEPQGADRTEQETEVVSAVALQHDSMEGPIKTKSPRKEFAADDIPQNYWEDSLADKCRLQRADSREFNKSTVLNESEEFDVKEYDGKMEEESKPVKKFGPSMFDITSLIRSVSSMKEQKNEDLSRSGSRNSVVDDDGSAASGKRSRFAETHQHLGSEQTRNEELMVNDLDDLTIGEQDKVGKVNEDQERDGESFYESHHRVKDINKHEHNSPRNDSHRESHESFWWESDDERRQKIRNDEESLRSESWEKKGKPDLVEEVVNHNSTISHSGEQNSILHETENEEEERMKNVHEDKNLDMEECGRSPLESPAVVEKSDDQLSEVSEQSYVESVHSSLEF